MKYPLCLSLLPASLFLVAGCARGPTDLEPLRGSLAASAFHVPDAARSAGEIDGLRDAGHLDEARLAALAWADSDPGSAAAQWRAARALADFALGASAQATRQQAALLGLEHARLGAALAPDDADAQGQLAFLLGLTTHLQPMSDRAAHARGTIAAAERALTLRPGDALAHETLGILHLRLATLPWIARLMARSAPRGTLTESEEHLRAAVTAAPSLETRFLLAKTLSAAGRSAEATMLLTEALAERDSGARDVIFRPQAQALLESLQ